MPEIHRIDRSKNQMPSKKTTARERFLDVLAFVVLLAMTFAASGALAYAGSWCWQHALSSM